MNRTISAGEAAVLERLELERPALVATGDLAALLDEFGIGTLPRVFAALAFKGGTALRKMWAGSAGRFSLDLDFSCADIDADIDGVLTDLIAATDGRAVGPFR
ncbi:MAG: nucleotidyl transferase AbiEii/AbiGii toxin family protein [Bifidobacteriaceae bacterium]|jgi:hypothetical protein|nr:nucleotidyl transferase AbiEii/AbiGii toxin family protein [Bifidobacteriaceae bacterium]